MCVFSLSLSLSLSLCWLLAGCCCCFDRRFFLEAVSVCLFFCRFYEFVCSLNLFVVESSVETWRLWSLEVFFFFWEKKVTAETKNSEGVGEESKERAGETGMLNSEFLLEFSLCLWGSEVFGAMHRWKEIARVFSASFLWFLDLRRSEFDTRKKMKKTRDVENVDAATARKSRARTRTRKSWSTEEFVNGAHSRCCTRSARPCSRGGPSPRQFRRELAQPLPRSESEAVARGGSRSSGGGGGSFCNRRKEQQACCTRT